MLKYIFYDFKKYDEQYHLSYTMIRDRNIKSKFCINDN